MRNLNRLLFVPFTLFILSPLFFSCSDDDPSTDTELDEPSEETPERPNEDIPEGDLESNEMLQKIHAIYDNASIDPQTVTTVHQLAILTSYCASADVEGPISVTPVSLNGEAVTLVTLGGTEEKEGQATTMKESQLAAFGKSNDYLTALVQLFAKGIIPQDKPVLVTGISLGGMIAQQLLGVQEVIERFHILGVITFGSPITLPLDRHGVKVVRFADIHDKVPQLGEMLLRGGLITGLNMSKQELSVKLDSLDAEEKVTRTSKYTGMIETHALSYIEDACWNDVDFMGDLHKKNVLVLEETMRFYPALKLPEE